jgi:sugar O-acyltransferase (sialic acid O-acetyltransferase NeuD family)
MATLPTAAQGGDPARPLTARPLVIVGGGEHARVVAEAAATCPDAWQLIGFTDDDPDAAATHAVRLGLLSLGDDATFAGSLSSRPAADHPALVLGFGGSPEARQHAIDTFGPDARWATVIHATAWVSPSAVVEAGAVILAGAVVNAGAVVGAHAIVNSRVVVEHDVHVGAATHLAPGVVVGGGARIGVGTMVGLGAVIRDHVTVGRHVTIGMGAVVVGDVADGRTVLGVPARVREGGDG